MMANDVVPSGANVLEAVLIQGNLAQLSPQDRITYYKAVCDSTGLNPLTKPFEYIVLNGKLTLYALRSCTDQLRKNNGVSVVEMTESEREGVFIVTAKVTDKHGRADVAKGAVSIAGLKGEALANAMMKAETKAKRRATLSICGLGMLDETEVETIPNARPFTEAVQVDKATGEVTDALPSPWTDELRNTARVAAKQGTIAYTDWWKARPPEFRNLAVKTPEHEEFKAIAMKVGA